ncbi:MAG: DUF72 domain-containing protein [Runella slithyformis]|nr:MAG: DUF72 domain-containing protein [Runella slithyformis]TAF26424.1 MAG: DUF72 domain-containing protein [Runella slithyformis]TAF44712.1 MAG: DUF72 domain-containing protein [Runella slithyformis]TAF80523.1 MAG: DUF72 domain-containing protein [Runella slithyformis]
MDFGKLTDISGVDFTLPFTPRFTQEVLQANAPKPAQVYVGPPVWSNKEWLGKIYPTAAKEKDFLGHFARQFNTIELNVTHYQVPTAATVTRWREAVPPHFKFCPKWPQEISHERQLTGSEILIQNFVETIQGLGKNLGTTFLQLPPYFGPWKIDVLEKFLTQLPPHFPIAVEFRNEKWFAEPVWNQTLQLLQRLGVGTVVSDVAGRRDVLHQSLTTPALTLRFVGNELHPTDYTRVDAWVQRIKVWLADGLQMAYVFVHCGDNNRAPELTKYWTEQLNRHCGLALQVPHLQPKVIQGSLF